MAKEKINNLRALSGGWNALFILILSVAALFIVIPMLLVVVVSFSSKLSIANVGYSFFPSEWSLDGYTYLFKTGDVLVQSYLFTIAFTVIGTLLSLTVMSMFAYVISIRAFPLNRPLTWLLFFTALFSGGLVPSYMLNARYLHIDDSIWIFLLPGMVNVFWTIILRTFIRTTISDSLIEAAKIDGMGHFKIYLSIILPLSKAGLATIGLFKMVTLWNDWFIGLIYIKSPNLVPLQTVLIKLQDKLDFLKTNAAVGGTPDGVAFLRTLPDENLRMACTIIVILPMLFAYPFFQRYFVQGLTVGSIKE